ncbi:hypothetical protein [Tateyamaria pelophila]|uniref:hypothetical protein n=1 Tax=Tateyamaria pelophila TaxID=328415 RepID=UPI001CC09FCF|nr:hypothetical protein [Tateyamaria pelophila]
MPTCEKGSQDTDPKRQSALSQAAQIEECFARFKDWRRVATRYDQCPKVFLSAIALVATVLFWLKINESAPCHYFGGFFVQVHFEDLKGRFRWFIRCQL